MKTEERIEQQRELIETIGRHIEKEGHQPNAARVLGLLMVMDKEYYAFDEIVEELQISKSSASIVLRHLEATNKIEYKTFPNNRKKYYHLARKDFFSMINEFEYKTQQITELLKQIIILKADSNSENSKFFSDLIQMFEFFNSKIEQLKKEYKQKQ